MSTSSSEKQKTTPFGVILKIVGIIIIVAILLVGLLAYVPSIFGCTTASIVSGSMEPTIPVGSLVIAQKTPYEEIGSGDILMFNSGSTLVTHRVVDNDITVGQLTTKGDANDSVDLSPVSYYDVVGVVRIHLPAIGSLIEDISTRNGKIYMLVLLVVGVALVLAGGCMKKKA